MESCNKSDCTAGGVLAPVLAGAVACPAGMSPLECVDCTIGTF